MVKNNLFEFATSELSQDAFICWLLNFAHKDHLNEDSVLTECAKNILLKILPDEPNPIITRDIKKQYENIDILIEVNEKYNIIIEDKTFSNVHDDQINRYKKILLDKGKSNIKSVYFKIVEQPFEENVDINITRKDLLDTFGKYVKKTENVIFKDYYDYLSEIDSDVNSFKNEPIEFWRNKYNHVYKGFFNHLVQNNIIQTKEDDIINGKYDWGYVNNRNGGVWVLWWFSIKSDCLNACNLFEKHISELYLQIEDNKIVIKMIGDSQESQDVRWSLYSYCKNIMPEFEKKVFRKGNHMTVGYIKYDQNNYCEKIKSMEALMRSIVCGQYKFATEL